MLWDLIRDFFVQHVFGGTLSSGYLVTAEYGRLDIFINGESDDSIGIGSTALFKLIDNDNGAGYILLSDWLSTTATAISITIIVVLCCLMIYKIVRLIGGLIR